MRRQLQPSASTCPLGHGIFRREASRTSTPSRQLAIIRLTANQPLHSIELPDRLKESNASALSPWRPTKSQPTRCSRAKARSSNSRYLAHPHQRRHSSQHHTHTCFYSIPSDTRLTQLLLDTEIHRRAKGHLGKNQQLPRRRPQALHRYPLEPAIPVPGSRLRGPGHI